MTAVTAVVAKVRAANADALGHLSVLVRDARQGSVSAARETLHAICAGMESGRPLPEPLAKYLHQAFASYLSGAQPCLEEALNLVEQPGARCEVNGRVPVRIKRLRRIRVEGRGVRTSPVAALIEGTRRQSYLVARIYLRMKLHLMAKSDAITWVSRRYRVSEEALQSCDRDLDAIRGWTVEQLKSLIRLAK